MSKVQAGCLIATGFGILFHLARYFSPKLLVDWGSDPMTSSIGTIFGNSDAFEVFGLTMHPFIPLLAYITGAIVVIYMYKIEDAIINKPALARENKLHT